MRSSFADGAARTRTARSWQWGRRGTAATGCASGTGTGTTSTSGSVSRKCRSQSRHSNSLSSWQRQKYVICVRFLAKTLAQSKKRAWSFCHSSVLTQIKHFVKIKGVTAENDFSLCKMHTFAKCYPPDNPVSTSRDLSGTFRASELNPDSRRCNSIVRKCKHVPAPTSNIWRIFNFGCRKFGLLAVMGLLDLMRIFVLQMQTDFSIETI